MFSLFIRRENEMLTICRLAHFQRSTNENKELITAKRNLNDEPIRPRAKTCNPCQARENGRKPIHRWLWFCPWLVEKRASWCSLCLGKGPGKRGHIVADTLLPMMFLGLRKLGNICCGHRMFLNKIRNIFCPPDTKFVSASNVARAGKRGNICVGNNVSSFARALKTESGKRFFSLNQ